MKFIRINWDLQAFILSVLVFQSHCTCMMQWNTRLYYVCTKCKTRLVFFFHELIPQFIFLHFIFWKKSQVRFTLHQSPLFIFSGANKISEIFHIPWRHILIWRELGVTKKHVRAIRYQMKLRHNPLSMHNLMHCSLLADVFSSLSYLFNKNIMFADL